MTTKGNQFWKQRAKHGRDKRFVTADDLWQQCLEYFEWVENNPLFEGKVVSYMGDWDVAEVPKMRAMTLTGLQIFLGITKTTWHNYKQLGGDYLNVCEQVESVIYDQKFTGAAADLLNASIIARDLGLKDKHDVSSEDGTMTPQPSIDASQLSTETLLELSNARRNADAE